MRTKRLWRAVQQPVANIVRHADRRARLVPGFLVIGAQKAGTTSIYRFLESHPRILGAEKKEIHFFDTSAYRHGMRWYLSHFPSASQAAQHRAGAGGEPLTGEASPYYLFYPHAPRRVAEAFPDIRLLVVLRDPVERAWSHYQHSVRYGREKLSFSEAVEREDERVKADLERMERDEDFYSSKCIQFTYRHRGMYLEQLRRWWSVFGESAILVLKSEDLFGGHEPTFRQLGEFLGLDGLSAEDFPRRNVAPQAPSSLRLRRESGNEHVVAAVKPSLRRFFEGPDEELFQVLGWTRGWSCGS